jgi:PKD repeat protein
MALLLFGLVAGAAVLEVAETASVAGAGNVPVDVLIYPESASISALQFDLVFDTSDLTFQTSPAPTRGDATLAAEKSFAVQVIAVDRVRVVVVGGQSLLPAGTLGTVCFDVAPDAAGTLPVTIENALASDPWGLPVGLALEDGGVLIPAPRRLPIADFSGTPRSGVAPFTVSFSDQSDPTDGVITSWSWNFGDGATSEIADAFHIYETPGVYDVGLTVTSTEGSDSVTKPDYITVFSPDDAPTADFTASPTSGSSPLLVQFVDESLDGAASIVAWQWDFSDGGFSFEVNPTHQFVSPGLYNVSLTVTSPAGSDTLTAQNLISVEDPLQNPVAAFSATPTRGGVPLVVTFTDQSTPSPGIVRWEWNFGDGGTSNNVSPTHEYSRTGVFSVTLTVFTPEASDQVVRSSLITVTETQAGPIASFFGQPTRGNAGFTAAFTDTSEPGDAPITAWLWNFGDGGTSVLQHPEHVYSQVGVFDVTLTVATAIGEDDTTAFNYIEVFPEGELPTANFTATPRTGAPPLTVQFTDLSEAGSTPITGRQWEFGDGGTSILLNPEHLYAQEGAYDVTLTVFSASGQHLRTALRYIVVDGDIQGPAADFEAAPTTGDAPLAVVFGDQSTPGTSPITAWLWEFGDGATSTEGNPSHTYAEPGDYDVMLTVTTEVGNDSITKPDFIAVTEENGSPIGCGGPAGSAGADSAVIALCGAVLVFRTVRAKGRAHL